MSKFFSYSILIGLSIILLSACSRRYSMIPAYGTLPREHAVGRYKTLYLADQIKYQLRDFDFENYNLAITTFVNLNRLYETSPFGRYVGEQMIHELHQKNFQIVDLRQTKEVLIQQQLGELTLSRDAMQLAEKYELKAILAGTYTDLGPRVVLNARILEAGTGKVLATASAELSKTRELENLMHPVQRYPRFEKLEEVPLISLDAATRRTTN